MGEGGYDPQDFEDHPGADTRRTPLFGAQEFEPFGQRESRQGRLLFPPPGGTRGGDSIASSRRSNYEEGADSRSNELLKDVSLRVCNLKRGAAQVDATLASSFREVRVDLDDVWKEVDLIKLVLPVGGRSGTATPPRFVGLQLQVHPPPVPGLSPPAFQALMRQVVNELLTSGFVTHEELEARVLPTSNPNIGNQLSGLS